MVYNFRDVLLSCVWFRDAYSAQHPRSKAWLIQRGAFAQHNSFAQMADDMLKWFPDGTTMHNDALLCAVDLRRAANQFSDLHQLATHFLSAYDATTNIEEQIRALPDLDEMRATVTRFHEAKRAETHECMEQFIKTYPSVGFNANMFKLYPPEIETMPPLVGAGGGGAACVDAGPPPLADVPQSWMDPLWSGSSACFYPSTQ